ncbi:MnhB domain-containing protein [Lactococcus lactis]|uniref:MnhB domain-containing protein n=1 Tax=Lactococcus lactis TaxID=1358 RepID=UPI003D0D4458
MIFGLLILNSSFFNLGGKVIDTVQIKSADINTSVIEKIKIGGVSNGKPDLLQTMVITPFERMNFDNDKQYGTKSENVNKLINSGGDAGKVADIRKAEKVSHLRFNEIGDKFSVALGAVINNFVLGCGVLLFKLGALIAGIAFLVFLLVAPIVAFLVFLSVFEQAGKNLVVKTGVTLILSVLLGYATTLFLSLNNFLDTIFGGAGANYLFMSIAKVIVYVILFKFRGFFFSVLGNASSAITNNRAFNAMDTAFSRAKQRTLQPILAGGTAGIIAGKTFAKDINYKVGTGAINRRRSENRFKKYGESMKNILDPNSDEKKRNKATKQKERFEKRFEKQNKKAEKKQQNTQTSETKKKRASDKVAPYSDMNKAQPKTETGKNLKDLKQKSEQKVEHDKKLEQLRPATERMVKNTQQNYEKKHQSAESRNQAIVKGVKANQEQKASAQRMAQRFEKNKQRFSPNSNKPTKTSVKQSVKSEDFKRENTQINRPTKTKNEL